MTSDRCFHCEQHSVIEQLRAWAEKAEAEARAERAKRAEDVAAWAWAEKHARDEARAEREARDHAEAGWLAEQQEHTAAVASAALWERRALAMASEEMDSAFDADSNEWRRRSVKAAEAVGWLSPLDAVRLRALTPAGTGAADARRGRSRTRSSRPSPPSAEGPRHTFNNRKE